MAGVGRRSQFSRCRAQGDKPRAQGVVELAANSPKANMTSGRDSGAPATEEGGRRPWKAHRRALARDRKQ